MLINSNHKLLGSKCRKSKVPENSVETHLYPLQRLIVAHFYHFLFSIARHSCSHLSQPARIHRHKNHQRPNASLRCQREVERTVPVQPHRVRVQERCLWNALRRHASCVPTAILRIVACQERHVNQSGCRERWYWRRLSSRRWR